MRVKDLDEQSKEELLKELQKIRLHVGALEQELQTRKTVFV